MRYIVFLLALILSSAIYAQQDQQQPSQQAPQQTPEQPPQQQPPGTAQPQSQPAASQATTPQAQGAAAKQAPSWLVGNWQGEGNEQGNTFSSQLSVDQQLDGEVILMRRSNSLGYKDVMIFGTDKASNKLVGTVYDNKNHIGIYACDTSGAQQIVCNQVATQGGFTSKLTIQLVDPTKLHVTLESGSAGQATKTMDLNYQKS